MVDNRNQTDANDRMRKDEYQLRATPQSPVHQSLENLANDRERLLGQAETGALTAATSVKHINGSYNLLTKLDKAVSTNDTLLDLERALTYEAVFNSLIENKMLAMKRDCEERKRTSRLKRSSIGRIFLARKLFGTGGRKAETKTANRGSLCKLPPDQNMPIGSSPPDTLSDSAVHSRRHVLVNRDEIEVASMSSDSHDSRKSVTQQQRSKIKASHAAVASVVVAEMPLNAEDSVASTLSNVSLNKNLLVHAQTHTHTERLSSSLSNEHGDNGIRTNTFTEADADISRAAHTSTLAEGSLTSLRDSLESLSFANSNSLMYEREPERIIKRLRLLEARSISAQCSPLLPRHALDTNKAHDETAQIRSRGTQAHNWQLSRALGTELHATVQRRTPETMLPPVRRLHSDDPCGLPSGNFGAQQTYTRYFSRQNTSEDSANLTVSTLLNQSDSLSLHACPSYANSPTSATVTSFAPNGRYKSKSTSLLVNRRSRVLLTPIYDDSTMPAPKSILIPIDNNDSDALNAECIFGHSNHNRNRNRTRLVHTAATKDNHDTHITQMTEISERSDNLQLASLNRITAFQESVTTAKASGHDAIVISAGATHLHRLASTSTGSSIVPTGCCTAAKTAVREKDRKGFKPCLANEQGGSDDEYRRQKRKYKRYHRCSDPVLVYPMPNTLQHCILNVDPDEPVQYSLNETVPYDTQIPYKADDLQQIIPKTHRHHRKPRHHHHKKRHRHRKSKLIVQDLETQVVKVIDPHDLSQRARWTIIATACLLLLMCLMLVGITLRMAPIIDDMGGGPEEDDPTTSSSFEIVTVKKKPPKLKSINRSLSMAIDNYAPPYGVAMDDSTPQLMLDDSLIIEQPLIHRSASPVAVRSAPPPQTLALPAQHQFHTHYSGGSISPTLSARQQHHQQHQHQMHMHSFQHLAAQTAAGSSSTSSPTLYAVSPVKNAQRESQQQQPDIYLVSSSDLGDEYVASRGRSTLGGSTSPIQYIDDDMLQPATAHRGHLSAATHTHPLKKTLFRRSDTIDVHPSANFQMKKTHSFHMQQQEPAVEQLRLAGSAASSGASSRRTSSVRANFLMPGTAAGGKELSRSPSPSRRGCRSHRSFNDPSRRPSIKPESVVESQIRHPSLNDDLLEPIDGRPPALFSQANLSLEDQLFLESHSRSNSHTKMENVGLELPAVVQMLRKSSGSFEETIAAGTHPTASTSSLKQKREHQHARQQSSHSLELDGRPTKASAHPTHTHTMQLHSAAAAATAAYHFKRGAQHGRSLYLSPNNLNLEELTVHRPGVIAAAAAFQGTNASANVKQAKALHSASMRLRNYRENLSASKKSKSFIAEGGAYPPAANMATDEFELTSPHRRSSRPLATAASGAGAESIDEIKRSPRPLASATTTTAFIEEKRPSFERKPSLTYELSDAAFAAQVLRPFHHKVAAGRKESLGGAHKSSSKKISISDETDEEEDVDRKRKRIVCIVLIVFLCLVCAGVFVIIVTLTHGQSHPQQNLHQQSGKKIHIAGSRDTPVHYTVRLENDRIKETLDRARFSKNFTENASLVSLPQMQQPMP